ncbi:MAG TPA: ATP synthase F0 subunit A [Firmicutes bacterium]|nr:ATP synthase F0 subunit A [Bacillota bacterium]
MIEGLPVGLEFGIPFPGLGFHDQVIFTNALIVMALIFISSLFIVRGISLKRPTRWQIILEGTLNWLANIMEETIGSGGSRYLPLIASLFIYVLVGNLISIIPGCVSPTSNLTHNLALALIVFFATPVVGIMHIGFKNFFKHRLGPVLALSPLFFVLETIGEFSRPVSLTIRLFGNIRGEEILIAVINKIASMIYYIPITVVILPLTLITGFVQAFIFALLPTIYFAGAAGWGEEEHK